MPKKQRRQDGFREYLTANWPAVRPVSGDEADIELVKRKLRRQLRLLIGILVLQLVLFLILIYSSKNLG